MYVENVQQVLQTSIQNLKKTCKVKVTNTSFSTCSIHKIYVCVHECLKYNLYLKTECHLIFDFFLKDIQCTCTFMTFICN